MHDEEITWLMGLSTGIGFILLLDGKVIGPVAFATFIVFLLWLKKHKTTKNFNKIEFS